MSIEKNKVVTLTYVLTVDNEIVDTATKDQPLAFLYGAGGMIEGFENNLAGLNAGDSYRFDVAPEQAYGPVIDDAIVNVPRNIFVVDGAEIEDLKVGVTLPLSDQQGNPLQGKVLEIHESEVKLDFNHPLAGKQLNFSGEVMEVRDATEEELAHGHAHGPNGHQH